MEKIKVLTSFYGTHQKLKFDGKEAVSQLDVDPVEAESEWKLFRRIIFKQYSQRSLHDVLSTLTGKDDIKAGFPNLSKLAAILEILPVTTATVERSFSSMTLIKTRLRSRMGEEILEHAMRIFTEGPECLPDETLEEIIENYKKVKKRKIAL